MKYYRRTEKVWRKVYKDEAIIKELYRGFDKWLHTYGREIIVSKQADRACGSSSQGQTDNCLFNSWTDRQSQLSIVLFRKFVRT